MEQHLRQLAGRKVAVVDDDASVRDTLSLLLQMEGYQPHLFSDGQALIDALQTLDFSCIVLDVFLPGLSGIEVLERLSRLRPSVPVIVMSGQSDIPVAVQSMKAGAIDFIEKPFAATAMIDRIAAVILNQRERAPSAIDGIGSFAGLQLLTEREREVLGLLAYGASNKEAGRQLGISPRTVEVHRARIMEKLGARNSADMMRIVLSGQVRMTVSEER